MNVMQFKFDFINQNIEAAKNLMSAAVIQGAIQNGVEFDRDARRFGYSDSRKYLSGVLASTELIVDLMFQNALFELMFADGDVDDNELDVFKSLFSDSDGYIFKFIEVNDWVKYCQKGPMFLIKQEVKLIERQYSTGMYTAFAINIGSNGDSIHDMIVDCCRLALVEFATVDGAATRDELSVINDIAEKYFTGYNI